LKSLPGRSRDGIKITGLTKIETSGKGTLLLTYDKLTDKNGLEGLRDSHVKRVATDGFEMLAIQPPSPSSRVSLRPGQTIINYWLIK
jgi:hypothetical protein